VIIPKANIPHLMLREDVVAAAAAGQFHVFAVTSVDEALALLLNTAAGDRDDAGEYSPPEPLTIGLSGNSGSGPLSRPR
jgi:predicted ATP-dependent protease